MARKDGSEAKTWEDYLSTLTLHKGAWAIETDEGLYMFPQHTTKEEALKVLRIAYEHNQVKFN